MISNLEFHIYLNYQSNVMVEEKSFQISESLNYGNKIVTNSQKRRKRQTEIPLYTCTGYVGCIQDIYTSG